MSLKDLWKKAAQWWTGRSGRAQPYDSVDEDGLLHDSCPDSSAAPASDNQDDANKEELIVKKASHIDRKEGIEKLGQAFDALVDQLHGINEHLGKQITQHEDLMGRIDQLPELLKTLPGAVQNQEQVVEALTDELKSRALKDKLFAEAIEKIPAETARQTNAIRQMNDKLSVSTDIDTQMSQGFNRFNDTLAKLQANTADNADSITQMSKTFAASDRYLKYIIGKHNRRFLWVLASSLGVCLIAIIALVIAIFMLLNR